MKADFQPGQTEPHFSQFMVLYKPSQCITIGVDYLGQNRAEFFEAAFEFSYVRFTVCNHHFMVYFLYGKTECLENIL